MTALELLSVAAGLPWLLILWTVTSVVGLGLVVSILFGKTNTAFPRDQEGNVLRNPKDKLPLLYHTYEVASNDHRQLDKLMEMAEEMGTFKTFFFKCVGHYPYVVVSDPRILQHVLRTNADNYPRGQIWVALFRHLLGDCVLTTEGTEWLMHRKHFSHMFKHDAVKNGAMHVLKKKTGEYLKRLEMAEITGRSVDLQDLSQRFTLDVIGEFACGTDIKTLSGDKAGERFMEAFEECMHYGRLHFILPTDLYLPLRFLHPMGHRYTRNRQLLQDFASEVVRKRRAEGEASWAERHDVVSLFLSKQISDKDGQQVSETYMRDTVLLLLFAGRDNSGVALSWSLYNLYTHPEVLAKARDECKAVLESDGEWDEKEGRRVFTYESFSKLKYLEAVIFESLRLYPSVPIEIRSAVRDDVLPDGTQIKADNTVLMSPYLMGRLSEIWDEPLKFMPERHLEGGRPSPFKLPAFLAGPHICIGLNLAVLELKYLLAHVILAYDADVDRALPARAVQNSVMLSIDGGFPVHPHRRVEQRDMLVSPNSCMP